MTLVVGGYACPTSGEIAGRQIPSDGLYYLTTYGGGSDTQSNACGGPIADGSWYYIADRWRFGCGAKVRITNSQTGATVVALVADVGPNVCVEQAAGRPVIDASPLVAMHLFGTGSVGWSDRREVIAELADPWTPLGPSSTPARRPSSLTPRTWLAATALFAVSGGATWWWLQHRRRRR